MQLPRRALLAALTVGAVAGCRRARRPVVLGVASLRISLPVFVAASRHLFDAHDLSIELRSYVTAQPMIDDLLLGRLDAAGFAAYPIVLASAKGSGAPLVSAGIVEDRVHRLSYALARKGSSVRFPRGLAGTRVGILPTLAYRRWLEAILRAAGVAVADVQIAPIPPPMQARALADGAVDVLFTNDPMATAILASGAAEIVDDGPPCAKWLGEPFDFGGFFVGRKLAAERRREADRLVAAIDAAIDAVRADPVAARQALAAHVREDERAWIDRYPDARLLRSSELTPQRIEGVISRARTLGVFAGDTEVAAWPPR